MRKVLKSGLVVAMVLVFGTVSLVNAADTKRDRKRDGSCLNTAASEEALTLAKIQKRDRKRDGSCLNTAASEEALTLAKIQKRDRKRDGSCQV